MDCEPATDCALMYADPPDDGVPCATLSTSRSIGGVATGSSEEPDMSLADSPRSSQAILRSSLASLSL